MNLSLRLQQIADFVPECECVADVGTDHAHLPVYLIEQNRCRRCIAMDIGRGPLEHAAAAVKSAGYEEQIELRLADGLTKLQPGEADVVTISGMGGLLIVGILKAGAHTWDSVKHFILSPQSEYSQFRHFLAENGFGIEKEKMVFDMEKYYVIIDVVRGTMNYEHEYEYAYGKYLIEHRDVVLKDYLEQKSAQLGKVKEGLEKAVQSAGDGGAERSRMRLAEINQKLDDIVLAQKAAGFC